MSRWRRSTGTLVGLAAVVALVFGGPRDGHAQTTGVLRVRVSIDTSDGSPTLRRHVLLVSDNPVSRSPWHIVIGQDGSGKVNLPPGNYTVESEEPLVFQGRTYEWRQVIDVTAGSDTILEFTVENAEVGEAGPTTTEGTPATRDAWDLLVQWEDSVVALWTPMTHASGVVIAPTGLIATTQRVVSDTTHVEVQLTKTLKVAARVLVADQVRNVTILWIDPATLGSRQSLPLGCGSERQPVKVGQPLSAIGTPIRRPATASPGTVRALGGGTLEATFEVPIDSAGGPVFATDGSLIGLASLAGGSEPGEVSYASVVPADAVCEVVTMAQAKITGAAPAGTPLPVEPAQVVTEDVLRAAVKRRTGSLAPSKTSSSSFDIELITPETAYDGMQRSMDFGQWSTYVAGRPAVLLVRVMPKQSESLWLKVARGAAMTQGIALPPITHYEPGFAHMRVLCGDDEVVPIHPFVVERRISENAAVREGLYVLATDALGPHCGTVTFEVYSEKSPDKRETASVDAPVLQRIWEDLTPYRSQTAAR